MWKSCQINNLTIGCIFNSKGANLTIPTLKTIVSLNFCLLTHEKGTIPTLKTITALMRVHPPHTENALTMGVFAYSKNDSSDFEIVSIWLRNMVGWSSGYDSNLPCREWFLRQDHHSFLHQFQRWHWKQSPEWYRAVASEPWTCGIKEKAYVQKDT